MSYVDISDWIQCIIKRQLALRKVKNYLSPFHNAYSLKNKNVTLIFNKVQLSIACMNIKDRKENFKVKWDNYKDDNYMAIRDNVLKNFFNETFNQICVYFNEDTTYEKILNLIQESYSPDIAQSKDANKSQNKNSKKDLLYIDDYLKEKDNTQKTVNINTADINELSQLPGINIVMAKRIIKYRKEHNGFDSYGEFYKEFNIKPHFQRQLNKLIYIDFQNKDIIMETPKEKNKKNKCDEDGDIIIDSLEIKPENNGDRIIDL
ncbi:helix-hairpin-helix domain-containing protein [bacterium]|nr:helix-hairpin-helix domain-containing protein [bacterium]